jgi:kynurenine formamidase
MPDPEEERMPAVGRISGALDALGALTEGLSAGSVQVVDLTQPLSDKTPIIQLPEPFVNTPGFSMTELSRYDDRGPAWYWNELHLGEHVGTHFDAPVHWITGKDLDDLASIDPARLIGPTAVIDKRAEAAADPDYLLTIDDIESFESEHGTLPAGGWLVYRTGWERYAQDQGAFLNVDETGSHTPGVDPECARWIAQESGVVGLGVETVGTDAGLAGGFDPPFPCHSYMHGAGKFGLTQLANLGELPARGAVIVVAPLKTVGGSGSPARALALVPN